MGLLGHLGVQVLLVKGYGKGKRGRNINRTGSLFKIEK
jgi:hypothetical protein